MKKVFGSVMLLALLVVTSGCGCRQGSMSDDVIQVYQYGDYTISDTLKDGEYTELTEGRNGEFEVTVTIKKGKITKVKVGDNEETENVGGAALKELAQKIVEEQTPNVDKVSGATISSFAIRDAVSRALEKASEVK